REAAYAGIGKADLADRHAYLARWAAGADPRTLRPGADAPAGPSGKSMAARDKFIAEHVERAVALADEVGLPRDADARSVVPLGVAALGRAAWRALATGEPALATEYGERALALAGENVPPADRLVYARALLQTGRASEALA